MKQILLINFGGIGDEILFLPVISSLKKEYPNSNITLVMEKRSKAILNLTKLIDNSICVDIKQKGIGKYFEILRMILKIRKNNYDIAIASGKSPFIAVILFLTGIKTRIGYKTGNEKTDKLLTQMVDLNEEQYAGKMYHDLVKSLIRVEYENPEINIDDPDDINCLICNDIFCNGFIAIHPGVSNMSISKKIYKCPDVNFWVKLIDKIKEKGRKVVLLGGPDDNIIINQISKRTTNFINLCGKTKNMLDMAKIINKADAFICVDSAPMHVGIALNKKLIAIFGPTNERKLIPDSENFHIITTNDKCRPCLWHKRQQNCEHSNCLKINVDEILKFL